MNKKTPGISPVFIVLLILTLVARQAATGRSGSLRHAGQTRECHGKLFLIIFFIFEIAGKIA